jgi:translation elongation factor EF-4
MDLERERGSPLGAQRHRLQSPRWITYQLNLLILPVSVLISLYEVSRSWRPAKAALLVLMLVR